jgi:hypothetical protein
MCVKAPCKLFLFRCEDRKCAQVIDWIGDMMRRYPYHLKGERYMAIGRTSVGAVRYSLDVDNDGSLESPSFVQLGSPLPWPWI